MTYVIGINPDLVKAGTTTDGVNSEYKLGSMAAKADGSRWIYIQAGEALSQYMLVAIDEKGQALKLTSALALVSHSIGVVQIAFADNDFGWALIEPGMTNDYKIGVLSACDSDVDLMTSATAGYLDDVYTTFVPLTGWMIATTLASTGGATLVGNGRLQLSLRTSGV